MDSLKIDPARWALRPDLEDFGLAAVKTLQGSVEFIRTTNIFIRAQNPDDGHWENIDICFLDTPSLRAWLTSRGGDNPWAENCVLLLLGHVTQGGPHMAVPSPE